MKTVSVANLAYYILMKVGSASQLKIQKLLYYVQAWHLAYFEQPIVDEEFEAWVHGPVVRSFWKSMKDQWPMYDERSLKSDFVEKVKTSVEGTLELQQIQLIDNVLGEYGDKTAFFLENLTHNEKPWIEARKGLDPSDRCERHISRETMKEYYQSLIA